MMNTPSFFPVVKQVFFSGVSHLKILTEARVKGNWDFLTQTDFSSVHHDSGQIIATSHDLTQKVAKEGKSPYFRET